MAEPSSRLDGLLCAFGSNNNNFALATPDGRVRTYDTGTGRLRSTLSAGLGAAKGPTGASNGHLAAGQQCLTWIDSPAPQQLSAAEARSSNPAGSSRSWVAVGTSAGGVKVYDSATGELKWQAASTNEGGVACLTYTASRGGQLFSSGPDGQAVSLDPQTGATRDTFKGSKHGATGMALSADGKLLLLGGSTLSLWELEGPARLTRLTGHPLPVRAVAFSPDARCALSAAVGERLVALWVVVAGRPGSKKKAGAVAAASLAVSQPVVQLATSAAAEGFPPGTFYAAATTEAGEAYVWLISPKGETGVDARQVARLAVDANHKHIEAICAAALEPSATGATLVAAVGSGAKPRFERVPVGTQAVASTKLTYLQPPPPSGDLIRPGDAADRAAAVAAGGSGAAAAAAEVLGADNAGELVAQRLGGRKGRKRSEPEPDGAGEEDEGDGGDGVEGGADGMDEEEEEEEEEELAGEPTLGQRVWELEQQQQQEQQEALQQQQEQDHPAAAAAAAGGAGAELPPGPLKADSLAVLLSQALRSADAALLERCLAVGRERMISNSVRRLVPMDAALLLRAAVERLQTKPRRAKQLAAWVQAVLLHHTAYLMAAPAAAPLMSTLYQLIEARLAMQRQLLSLAGRLELLLAQRGPAGGALGGGASAAAAATAQVVYEESDSEAEVEVVGAAAGASDSEDDDGYYTDDADEGEEEDDMEGLGSEEDGGDGSSSSSSDDDDEPGGGSSSDGDGSDDDDDDEEDE